MHCTVLGRPEAHWHFSLKQNGAQTLTSGARGHGGKPRRRRSPTCQFERRGARGSEVTPAWRHSNVSEATGGQIHGGAAVSLHPREPRLY